VTEKNRTRRDAGLRPNSGRWAILGACAAGILIALVDSRPGWDDTGVTVAAVLAAGAVFGALRPDRAISSAVAIGVWIPAFEIPGNVGSLLALAMALAGSGAGAMARKAIGSPVV